MKLTICCLIIVANLSNNNSKASIENISLDSRNVLLEDTTKSTDNSCSRICKLNVKPRRCYYRFKIEPTILDDGKVTLTTNGISPGPPITVCLNDVIVVEVENRIPDQDLTIHWHGVEQKGTPYMDGVPMVTQCPIGYGSKYKYAFIASVPGTFFYHSDSVLHQTDGVYGSLIVNQPQPLDPHSSLYDYDRTDENNLLIAAKYQSPMTGSLEALNLWRPTSLIVNGEVNEYKMNVMSGFAYRLRLTNAIAIECPIIMRMDQHEMMVIASDARPVKPIATKQILLYPGERMDVVVRATREGGGYWMQILGDGACAGLSARVMVIYSGFNYTSMLHERDVLNEVPSDVTADNTIIGQKLEAHKDVNYPLNLRSIYLGINRTVIKYKESDNDFRYISDAVPKKPFFPASLYLSDSGVVQINNKSFLYPSAPILLRSRNDRPNQECRVGEEGLVNDIQCVLILNAHVGEVLELVLVNEGISDESYTFHIHGYSIQVVATMTSKDVPPITRTTFLRMNEEGKIMRNLQNPVIKDTVNVPSNGFTIIRVKVDRGGSWMLECRACSLSSLPTAVLIHVPQPMPKPVIDSLPKCGTYKPPDVLLN